MDQLSQEAKRLRSFRKNIGVSQVELAKEIGVTQDTISRYESGEYAIPLDLVKHLYKKYKLNYTWFFHGFGKSKVDEVAKATIVTDLKEVLMENNILKTKVKVLEEQLQKVADRVDRLELNLS